MGQETEKKVLELESKMKECENSVKGRIVELEKGFAEIKLTLREQAVDRHEYNKMINNKIDAIHKSFDRHTEEEMKKYDKIVESLDKLTEATKDNSAYINKHELEEEKAKAIEEYKKGSVWYRIKDKVVLVAVSTITVATLGFLWKVFIVVLDLYNKMNGVA